MIQKLTNLIWVPFLDGARHPAAELKQRRNIHEVNAAEQYGREILDFGVNQPGDAMG